MGGDGLRAVVIQFLFLVGVVELGQRLSWGLGPGDLNFRQGKESFLIVFMEVCLDNGF